VNECTDIAHILGRTHRAVAVFEDVEAEALAEYHLSAKSRARMDCLRTAMNACEGGSGRWM
jgi:hypothetical protein